MRQWSYALRSSLQPERCAARLRILTRSLRSAQQSQKGFCNQNAEQLLCELLGDLPAALPASNGGPGYLQALPGIAAKAQLTFHSNASSTFRLNGRSRCPRCGISLSKSGLNLRQPGPNLGCSGLSVSSSGLSLRGSGLSLGLGRSGLNLRRCRQEPLKRPRPAATLVPPAVRRRPHPRPGGLLGAGIRLLSFDLPPTHPVRTRKSCGPQPCEQLKTDGWAGRNWSSKTSCELTNCSYW